jgi:hypothetical protein
VSIHCEPNNNVSKWMSWTWSVEPVPCSRME